MTVDSPLGHALERVGDRWSLLIVEALLEHARRFGELAAAVEGIAPNILTARLRQLEREGIVVARPYSEKPVRLSYQLSGSGRELAGALRMLAQWGARRTGEAETPRHGACGTPMDARWYCPTCARAVDEHEASDVRFL
jgi:DNA-binding HxlR family transcriptional regulator